MTKTLELPPQNQSLEIPKEILYASEEYFDWIKAHNLSVINKKLGTNKCFLLEPCNEAMANYLARKFWAPTLIKQRRDGSWLIEANQLIAGWVGKHQGNFAIVRYFSERERQLEICEITEKI